ncbi:major facilitator superfamily domain-containing protein [Suillus spraguei]|nr:major facilitator superfamily domain-containing protein [Suillus spraguei]
MIAVHQDDEETPLLQQPEQLEAKTPLPWDQFWIILVLQFSDQLVIETLAPFTPQLVRDIGVTRGDETQVGYYVGILHSSYYVTQTLTILYWSQLSDHIGRKPLILLASFAIASTMLSFGLSRSFLGLLVSRIICGAFNAQNGVIKNSLMDITNATNLPKAYAYLQISFMLAAIIGPIAGGLLSQPADRFPEIFGHSELLKTYPYLLPCAVSVICASIAWLVTCFYLRESVSTRALLLNFMKGWFSPQSYTKLSTTLSNAPASCGGVNPEEISLTPLPLRDVLTPKVLAVTASNGTLILFDIARYSILAIFYATPIELGGLSLDPPRIGAIFATSSFVTFTFQILFYARLHDHFGAYPILLTGLGSGIPIVILFPIINALVRAYGMGWVVWSAISILHMLMAIFDLSYASMQLFIRASAPNRASIGATNGVVQLVGGGARMVASACAGAVFSYSIQISRDPWLAYYFFMSMAFLAIGTSLFLPRDPRLWEEV